MYDDLTTLAIRHGTDKFGYHDYTPNYHAMFARFRDRPIRLLEIGVGGYGHEDRGGESLATWRDYFPKARIIGVDIEKKVLDLGDRVRIMQGSQVDADFLKCVVDEEGPFDIIIDDGSHLNEHVIESFRLLFPTLAPGGIYAVEDTQTAFFPRYGGGPALKQPNSVGFFAQVLVRLLTGKDGPDLGNVPTDGLIGMERFHNIVALHKADAEGTDAPVSWLAGTAAGKGRSQKKSADLKVLSEDETAKLDSEALTRAFDAVPEGGALVLGRERLPPALADVIARRFIEVDHMELRVHFPQADLHPMANEVRALSVTGEGIAFWRAPNLYPSNFAYDPEAPQAKAALERIGEVLADGKAYKGAVEYAGLLARFGRIEEAADLFERFGAGEGQNGRFYQLAVSSLRRAGRLERLRQVLESAVAMNPDDAKFVSELATMRMRDGERESAERLLADAIERAPNQHELHSKMARVRIALGKLPAAAESAEAALRHAPKTAQPAMRFLLAQARLRGRDLDGADEVLAGLCSEDPENDRVHRMMSELRHLQGKSGEALAEIDRALELNPGDEGHRRWRERIAG